MKKLEYYTRVSELRAKLATSAATSGRDVVYIVPSHDSDNELLDLIRGYGSFFGERPRVWSWQEIYTSLVPRAKIRRQIDPPDHMLILHHIIDEVIKHMDERGEDVPSGARRRGFADVLSSAVRELMLEDISPDAISDADGGELLYRSYLGHLTYLEANGLADNAQLPTLTRADMDSDHASELLGSIEMIWVGFLSFTGAQRKLIEALDRLKGRGASMSFFVPWSGIDGFRDAAAQIFPGVGPVGSRRLDLPLLCVSGSDLYAQYGAAAGEIRSLLDGTSEAYGADVSNIGVLTAEGRAGMMMSALRRRGIPCVNMSETKVSDTVMMETVRMAWDLYGSKWPTRMTMSLLASPVFGLEPIKLETINSAMPEGASAWRDVLSYDQDALDVFESCVRFCEMLDADDGNTPREIFEALIEFADKAWAKRISSIADEASELDDDVRAVFGARKEAERKLKMLEESSGAIGQVASIRLRGDDAAAYIEHWAEEASTAIQMPQERIVKVYDRPPSTLISHDIWVMTDVDAVGWSGRVADHALIGAAVRSSVNGESETDGLRERDHLPTPTEKRQQNEALFRRLVMTGEHVTILCRSMSDSQGREIGASPFAETLFDRYMLESGKAIGFTARETNCEVMLSSIAYRGTFPRAIVYKPAGKIKVYPSAVDVWRSCPFMFCIERLLGVSADGFEPAMSSPRKRGDVMHKIWEMICAECLRPDDAGGSMSIAAALGSRWGDLIAMDDLKDTFAADRRSFIVLERVRRAMLNVADIMDGIEASARAAGLVRTSPPLLERHVEGLERDHFRMSGYIDRVDIWNEGCVLVDYKLGSAKKYGDSLQLACYAEMLRNEIKDIDIVGWCWIGHSDGTVCGVWADSKLKDIYHDVRKESKKETSKWPIDAAAGIEIVRSSLAELDECVKDGVYKASYDSKACSYCGHSGLCRRAEFRGESFEDGGAQSDERV